MRDISIIATNIGQNISGNLVKVGSANSSQPLADTARIEQLLRTLGEQISQSEKMLPKQTAIDASALRECLLELIASVNSSDGTAATSQPAKMESKLAKVRDILGSSADILQTFFKLSGLFGPNGG